MWAFSIKTGKYAYLAAEEQNETRKAFKKITSAP